MKKNIKSINSKYKSRSEACIELGISYPTLYKLAQKGDIKVIQVGDRQKYDTAEYLQKKDIENPNKINMCYCRVFSDKYKANLEEQQKYFAENYPKHEIVFDIASELDLERPGLFKIIDVAITGRLNELVISNKTDLARIGYDLIEKMIMIYSHGKIINLGKPKNDAKLSDELSNDISYLIDMYSNDVVDLKKHKQVLLDEIKNKNKKK